MGLLEAIILGIIQGITEFLPVSSSGHLEIAKALFGNKAALKESLLFDVVVHGATALATIVVFRKDILQIFKGLFKGQKQQIHFSVAVIISMFPAAFVGFFFESEIEGFFGGKVALVGFMLFITGLLLYLADRAKKTEKNVGYLNAFIIGISQAIAIMPGISRSGATISTSVLLGIDRAKAARFSFLMVIPLILGKMAKDGLDLLSDKIVLQDGMYASLGAGFLAAFIVGIFACNWMIALVKRSKLHYFSIYCFAMGIFALVWWLTVE